MFDQKNDSVNLRSPLDHLHLEVLLHQEYHVDLLSNSHIAKVEDINFFH